MYCELPSLVSKTGCSLKIDIFRRRTWCVYNPLVQLILSYFFVIMKMIKIYTAWCCILPIPFLYALPKNIEFVLKYFAFFSPQNKINLQFIWMWEINEMINFFWNICMHESIPGISLRKNWYMFIFLSWFVFIKVLYCTWNPSYAAP